jgi:general secretion pathway protein A
MEYAQRKLLSLWGVEKELPANRGFCESVRSEGFECLREGSGIDGLNLYNRPAVISITVGNTESFAVVTKSTPESLMLDVVGREHTIPAAAIPNVWDGKFLLLWKTNDVFDGIISQGETGQQVAWLRHSIDKIEGTETAGDWFDAELVARVKQFQRTAGLVPDGIVGPRTYMVLKNKLALLKQE